MSPPGQVPSAPRYAFCTLGAQSAPVPPLPMQTRSSSAHAVSRPVGLGSGALPLNRPGLLVHSFPVAGSHPSHVGEDVQQRSAH
eukprot:332637-Amphidinium_carterae.1